MKIQRILIALAISATLAGCGISEKTYETQGNFEAKTQESLERQAKYRALPVPAAKTAIVNESFWVDTKPVRAAAAVTKGDLPPALAEEVAIGRTGNPGLLEIATLLTKASGIPVGFAPDASAQLSQRGTGATFSDVLPYRGKFSSLLDLVASRNNLFWRWTGERVEFFQVETRSFVIAALAGNMELKTEVGATQTTGTVGSNGERISNQSQRPNGISMQSKGSVWDSVKDAVNAMKSPKGLVAVTEATGMITVTDTPTVLRAVEAYLKTVNEALGKQVMVSVEVYAVQSREEESFAVSWDLIYTALSRQLRIGYSGGSVGPDVNSFSLLSDPNGSSRMAGSQGIFGALSQIGKTSMLTNATVVTMSGQPVPVQVTRETSYLAQVTAGSGNLVSGNTGPTLTPGVVTTGFALNVLPRVMENGDVLLQYSLDLSSLDDLTRVSSGGQSIQVPVKSNRNFLSRINMRSGQSLILGGLKQVNTSTSRQGPLTPQAWMFGGSDASRLDQAYLVVVITPNILDRSVN